MTVSGLLSGDSLPVDLQHVQCFTMVILRGMVLYICSHQLTVLQGWQYNDHFVQPDLFPSATLVFVKGVLSLNTDLAGCDTVLCFCASTLQERFF